AFVGIVPVLTGVDTLGTVNTDTDISVPIGSASPTNLTPVEFTCTLSDGQTSSCSNPSALGGGVLRVNYDIPESIPEKPAGGYTALVSAVDCVGNRNEGVNQAFQIDRSPPVELAAPAVVQLNTTADPMNEGVAQLTFSVRDAVTNVESIACNVDGVLDPACTASLRTTALTGLPRPDPSPNLTAGQIGTTTTRQFDGSATIQGLSAGEHVLTYTVGDIWQGDSAHVLVGTPTTFTITHGAETGWVSLIGHDFQVAETSGGTFEDGFADSDAVGPILGNMALRGRADDFRVRRQLRILRVNSDLTTATSKNLTSAKICERFNEVKDDDCDCSTDPFTADPGNQPVAGITSANNDCILTAEFNASGASAAADLRAAIRGYDVILISDLNNDSLAGTLGANATWLANLKRPVSSDPTVPNTGTPGSGGIIIGLDGLTAEGAESNTWKALGLGDANLVAPIMATANAPVRDNGLPVGERDCLGPSVEQLALNNNGDMEFYWAPENSVRFLLPDGDIRAAMLFSSHAVGGRYAPLIMTRQYRDWTAPFGPIRVAAWFESFERGFGDAVFNKSDGTLYADGRGVCRFREDGTVNYSDYETGGMVTTTLARVTNTISTNFKTPQVIAQPGPQFILPNETVTQVARFKQVKFGRRSHPDFGLGDLNVCSIPTFEGATNYVITTGCGSVTFNYDPNEGCGTVDPEVRLPVNMACAYGDFFDNVDVVLTARAFNGTTQQFDILAYATNLTTEPVVDSGEGDYTVTESQFGAWHTSVTGHTLTNSGGNGVQPRDRNVFLASATNGVPYQERPPEDQATNAL
ncbi:MAG TPA: hypothetical protein VMS14_01360, partial [Ilumatobacteraceae bacterium]|nr:hypothetical protein [Ilumatobacteraceae bacterium]